jgi:hypothetical protein
MSIKMIELSAKIAKELQNEIEIIDSEYYLYSIEEQQDFLYKIIEKNLSNYYQKNE